ncbi:Uncharacterised protein [Bordetella pertussis]|nr:Uncharacterised protein [Bordetella pertussis]
MMLRKRARRVWSLAGPKAASRSSVAGAGAGTPAAVSCGCMASADSQSMATMCRPS